uniref:Uncharacterized protein n=1 Tax=Cannabis sativa TaxID=3483 RepID=A0A803PV85_CANSA
MVSTENLANSSMARPSTRSQDGVPPPAIEHNPSDSNPDATSALVANNSMAPRRVPSSRSRSHNEEDNTEPVHPSPIPPPNNSSQPTRRSLLD